MDRALWPRRRVVRREADKTLAPVLKRQGPESEGTPTVPDTGQCRLTALPQQAGPDSATICFNGFAGVAFGL